MIVFATDFTGNVHIDIQRIYKVILDKTVTIFKLQPERSTTALGTIMDYHNKNMSTHEYDWNLYSVNETNHLRKIVQAISLYLVPTIGCLGIVGNICCFVVFLFTSFKYLPMTLYLAALAISDTGFLAAVMIGWLTSLHPVIALSPGCCHVMVYITYVCSFLSAWYVVLMMVERYIVVCHPLRAPRICTKRRGQLAVGLITAFALVLYIHSLLSTYVEVTPYAYCSSKSAYLQFNAVFTYIDSLLTFVVPFTAVLILNIRIILVVRNFRKKHHPIHDFCIHHSEPGVLTRAQVRTTKMLVLVSSVFVVLYLPSHAYRIYLLVFGLVSKTKMYDFEYDQNQLLAQHICQLPYYLNFAVDFLLYSLTSIAFRRNVVKLFRKICDDD